MALLETLHRADSKLNVSFKQAKEQKAEEAALKVFFGRVSDNISSGASVLTKGAGAVADGISRGAGAVSDSFSNKASDVATFFRGISLSRSSQAQPSEGSTVASTVPAESVNNSVRSSMTDNNDASFTAKSVAGVYRVDYSKYPIGSYVQLPLALQPFINLPGLDHYLVVARPTMDKSAGLAEYREVVPKSVRAAAPFLIIVDEAGKAEGFTDKSYIFYEFKLVDVFKLDVSKMKKFDDYLAKLSKKGRWNCKDRQKKLKSSPLVVEYIPLPRDKAFLDTIWPLYRNTGERNGFCVLGEADFYDFHTNVPDLTIMMIKDTSKDGEIVTFCTGVRAQDTIMPMWCGTNYEHELAMKCSTYYNMLYEYFKVAIEDPTINWVDLGATRRQAKTGIGCDPYPVSGYVRCKNSVMVAIVETMMREYFKPEELMNDP